MKKRTFANSVIDIVRRIPRGETLPYGVVARLAGFPGAAWAVGSVMRRNVDPTVPCHRVVLSDGRPGRYNRGDAEKVRLLREDGAL